MSLPRLSSLRAASPRLGSGAGEVDIEGGGVRGSDLRNTTKFIIKNPSSVLVLWIRDILGTEPDPAIFVLDLQDVNKKLFFSAYYFLKVQYINIIFSKIKSHKEVTKQ